MIGTRSTGGRPAVRFARTGWLTLGLLVVGLSGCNPMAAWTNNQNGKGLYRAGRYAEAREEFRRAAADSPRNPNYHHNFATAARKAGDPVAAEKAYRQALSVDPGHQPSYHGLAVTLHETGRTGDAYDLLTAWSATQPYSEKAWIETAWLQREIGDHASAERSLSQALAVKPGHPLALANLGQVYEETGRGHLAVTAYQKSLSTDWNQPQVAGRLARLNNAGVTASTGPPYATATAFTGGPAIATLPVGAGTVYAPAAYPATATGTTPVTAYLPPGATPPGNGSGLATHPFRPFPNGQADRLATNPFTASPQVFYSVPAGPTGRPVMFNADGRPGVTTFSNARAFDAGGRTSGALVR